MDVTNMGLVDEVPDVDVGDAAAGGDAPSIKARIAGLIAEYAASGKADADTLAKLRAVLYEPQPVPDDLGAQHALDQAIALSKAHEEGHSI